MRANGTGLLNIVVVSFTIAYVLAGASPVMAQGDCGAVKKAVEEAMGKLHTTSAHVYTSSKVSGQTFDSEMIYAGGSMYMKINGKWTAAGPVPDMKKIEANRNPNVKDTCSQAKDELVGGEMASVYSTHSETPRGGKLDMQMWVSKTKGLLLKQEVNTEGGKTVNSSRYEYGNVKAPL